MEIGLNRQTLHSVHSCLNILSLLCTHNPALCAPLFGQDVITDISVIFQECSNAIYPSDYKVLKVCFFVTVMTFVGSK